MKPRTRKGLYTFEEFCDLIAEDQKADLIDGVIYMASPDNTDAGDIFGWLFSLLHFYVEEKLLGTIHGSRIAFRLNDHHGPEPDIAFIRKDREHLILRGYVNGPPDVAIEIVSPDSIDRDYKKKRQQYQDARVPEYWIIDEIEETVTFLRLGSGDRYLQVRPRQGAFHSEVIEGFWFRPEWLWQRPFPNKRQILAQLLDE